MSRETPPIDYERVSVPRGAYIAMLKSCARLKELIRAKKTRKYQKIVFCYECGEIVENPKSTQRALCPGCKEAGKVLQEATRRATHEQRNRLKRKKK